MSAENFQPTAALRALLDHGVAFVVIGGVAAQAWGSPFVTKDLDICYERRRENLTRLVAALKSVHARLRGAPEGLPFILDERTLQLGDTFTFKTDLGDLDCFGVPSGTGGYSELLANSSEFEIEIGRSAWFASLDDVIRMKRAASRPKDLGQLPVFESLRDELRRQS